jgi:hypothetical protein
MADDYMSKIIAGSKPLTGLIAHRTIWIGSAPPPDHGRILSRAFSPRSPPIKEPAPQGRRLSITQQIPR